MLASNNPRNNVLNADPSPLTRLATASQARVQGQVSPTLYFMKRTIAPIIGGLLLGAASWAIVPLFFGTFEPFDSEIGFYAGQIMLATAAFYLGFSRGMKQVLTFIVGVYIGCNVYAYIFGSSETRAWVLLGLITTWVLCIFPLLSGIIGKLVRVGKTKYNKRLQTDAATPRA